jgi:hypothetical protein
MNRLSGLIVAPKFKLLQRFFIAALCSQFVACAAVTVRTDSEPKTSESASFEKRYSYYFWGLKGSHKLNVREVCQANGVEQMQTISTLRDSALSLFTVGIYAPRTARVWCSQIESADTETDR